MSDWPDPKKIQPETHPKSPYRIDPLASLKIIIVDELSDDDGKTVSAQFNPSQIQIDQAVSWTAVPKAHAADLEFTSSTGATMSFELLFDGFEDPAACVQTHLDNLKKMLQPMGTTGDKKRPPKLKVIWGSEAPRNLPKFTAVLESLSIKYTMFHTDGAVLRATASVKLKEASTVYAVGKAPKK